MFFVRSASDKDAEVIRSLLVETWHATYDGFYGEAKVNELIAAWHSLAAIKARINKRDGEYLVADDGRQIGGIGFAAMSETMTKTAILHQLYVLPAFQGEGIGRDIFAELETCFPDAEIMRLEVEPRNQGAISFYKRLGFVEVDRTKNCGDAASGIEALILEKPLLA
ncbi:GNAT family N-acetyltransferase [Rhizobium sp. SSA_523]|uniref:GNAT family N-acetyltransferase n=1 Tax=Rhizobium sp. SSA_523 TaxID=2952477 RepID=UPI00209067B2|nr:GNAT family N-acetyltransferase [Rhizobium sp. SSA_523]MCO5730598.1 GNAT family N-acetyltransferase [Rhizobium sp. SSA_523]WKC25873.1 GNAT family N-acetyltransferase [Rhizobium sp. SSA_523]